MSLKRILAIIGLVIIGLCFTTLIVSMIIGNQKLMFGMLLTLIFSPLFLWFILMLDKIGKFLVKPDEEKEKIFNDYIERLKNKGK